LEIDAGLERRVASKQIVRRAILLHDHDDVLKGWDGLGVGKRCRERN
jgi:hypothetical protein